MEHLDEQEMLIQFSEMAAFDFDSEEFRQVRKDYVECKNFISNVICKINGLLNRFLPA